MSMTNIRLDLVFCIDHIYSVGRDLVIRSANKPAASRHATLFKSYPSKTDPSSKLVHALLQRFLTLWNNMTCYSLMRSVLLLVFKHLLLVWLSNIFDVAFWRFLLTHVHPLLTPNNLQIDARRLRRATASPQVPFDIAPGTQDPRSLL